MRQRRHAARAENALERFLDGHFLPLHKAARAFVQIEIEGVLDVLRVALIHQHAREMGPGGQRLAHVSTSASVMSTPSDCSFCDQRDLRSRRLPAENSSQARSSFDGGRCTGK
jgi:hypothetical protein